MKKKLLPGSFITNRLPGLTLLFLIILITPLLLSSCNRGSKSIAVSEIKEAGSDSLQPKPTADNLFNLPVDSFNIIEGHIKANKFLSDILTEYGISYDTIAKLLENSKGVFDVRNIRAGNNYQLLCKPDSSATPYYFIYEHDPSDYYIFSLVDSLSITLFKPEPRTEIKFASGTIETSLWDAMITSGYNPTLAVELSEIYAWTIDFFGLQKGDQFKVIYEESFVGESSLGISNIFGASFFHSGTTTEAIPFLQDSIESYFDKEGNSLRKAFLKAPLQFSRISSRFSSGRLHPILRIVRAHYGVDYAAASGTPVLAIGDGRVTMAGYDSASGNIVKITHNSVYSTAYMHLSRYGQGIKAGVYVKQGDIIGYVGSTGLSTGPHLDFRFYKNGSPVDPLKVEAPPVEPVAESEKARFEKIKTVTLDMLDTF